MSLHCSTGKKLEEKSPPHSKEQPKALICELAVPQAVGVSPESSGQGPKACATFWKHLLLKEVHNQQTQCSKTVFSNTSVAADSSTGTDSPKHRVTAGSQFPSWQETEINGTGDLNDSLHLKLCICFLYWQLYALFPHKRNLDLNQ